MRASLLGSLAALALIAGAAAAWQTLGPRGLAIMAIGLGLAGALALRARGILEALPASTMLRTSKRPIVLGASLVVGAWLAATVLTLTSMPADALPPSSERVAELETNVDGLVAAVSLLGGPSDGGHNDGPPLTPAFPIAGAEPSPTSAATVTATPASTASATTTEDLAPASMPSSSFDFSAPPAMPTSTAAVGPTTAAVGATPSPLSQPRITSGPGGGPLDSAGTNRYNCTDFETWEQAVAVFRASGEADPNLLDTDGNGIPCEELKAAELSPR